MSQSKTRRPGGRGAHETANRAGMVLDDALIGRIEAWVVSTLDDRARPSSEADWRESLESFTLAKRPANDRQGSSASSSSSSTSPNPGGWARFRLSRRRGIAIVSLTDQALIKEADLWELAGDLLALVEAGHLRIVLDFSSVERLSSWAARTINEAVRPCFSTFGGSVKFSGLRPDLSAIFEMTGLDPRVAVYPDTASAVGGSWPDLPDLRPIPVSILTALMRAEEARPRPRPFMGQASRFSPNSCSDSHSSARGFEDQPIMFGARLIVQDGPFLGRSLPIRGARFLIGRGPDCQLRLGSSMVSRSHASIERRGRRFFLRDLASTNGSLLNGQPLRDREVEIREGDRLRFGPLTFALSVGESSPPFEESDPDEDRPWPRSDEGSGSTEEFVNLDGPVGLKHEVIEGVLVVTPLASELDDEAVVDAFREGLLALRTHRHPRRVVVNLAHVGHLSGRAIGVLVAHHLRLDRSGGALRVCLANPRVALVLEQVKLGMLVDYHPTVDEAVIATWPQGAASTV
jgi:anti-anti-sigma factor